MYDLMFRSSIRLLCCLSVAFNMGIASANAKDLPFRLATLSEINSLSQPKVIATQLSDTNFRTAAFVTARTPNKSASDAKRANKAISAVYKSVLSAGTDPNPHTVPPEQQPNDIVDYEVNHDSVQAWATMSETGAPFVFTYVDGKSSGRSAASWTTEYAVPGAGSREVYAQFKIPAVNFGDRWEDAAPSSSWARMRIDFLVNGYPAWSTETLRFNQVEEKKQKAIYVQSFGYSLGLDDDHPYSSAKTITVKLGTYPAGHALDFTLLFQTEGKLDSGCDNDGDEMVCGGVSVKIGWDPNVPQPVFYSKPAP